MKENNIIWGCLILLIITTIIDIYTALKSPVFELLESNPAYIMTGSIIPVIILNIILIYMVYRGLKTRISMPGLFWYILLCIYFIIGHSFGAYSNIIATQDYIKDPAGTIALAKQTTTEDKIQYITMFGIFLIYIPIIIATITFYLTYSIYKSRHKLRSDSIKRIKREINKLSF